jgi:hypothetical protein
VWDDNVLGKISNARSVLKVSFIKLADVVAVKTFIDAISFLD